MFRNRSLLGLMTAELVSLTGTAMTFVALPWFVLSTTGSTSRMGWVLGAQLLPVGLFGIPSGSLIARIGAKRTMLVCDGARGPLMLVLPVLHWTGNLSFGALLAVAFAVGCFSAPYFASSRLIVPEVTGEDEHAAARVNAVLVGGNQLTQIVGPVLAGLLIAASGPADVLAVDAASYAFSFVTVAALVRVGARVDETDESRGLLAGLRYLRRDPLMRPMLIAAVALNMFVEALVAGVNALAYFHYGADAHVAGILFAGFGTGALIGAVVAQWLTQKTDLLKLAAASVVCMPLPLFVLGLPVPWGVATVVLAAFAFFGPLVNAPILGVLSVRTPADLRPKVMTAVVTVATIAAPVGFFCAGEALRWISPQALFLAVAAALTAGGLACAAAIRRHAADALPVTSDALT